MAKSHHGKESESTRVLLPFRKSCFSSSDTLQRCKRDSLSLSINVFLLFHVRVCMQVLASLVAYKDKD